MAICTRSGRLQKDETSDSARGRTNDGKEEEMKGSSTSGSPLASCSRIRTDSSTFKRSCLDTPVKDTSSPCPVTRRSKRLAEHSPSLPSDDMKPEGSEKKRSHAPPSLPSDDMKPEGSEKKRSHSPLRRSKRIEDKAPSTTIVSKNLKRGVGSAGVKKKKDTDSGCTVSKKKRLDARSYRESLRKLQVKKVIDSDVSRSQEKGQNLPHRGTIHSQANDFKELHKYGGVRIGLKVAVKEPNLDESDKEAIESSSSGSRELAERTMKDDGPRGSPKSSKKRKLFLDDADESKCEDDDLASKCSDSSRQSSPTRVIAKEVVDAADKACCFARDVLGTVDLIESACEARSFDVDNDVESQNVALPLRRMKTLDREICSADDISPSTFGTKNKFVELCAICCKRRRASSDLKDKEICSCNCKTNHDVSNISSSEEVCEHQSMLETPSKAENVASSFQKDNITRTPEQIGSEHFESQIRDAVLTDPPTFFLHASISGEKDVGELEVQGVVNVTGELDINPRPKDSPWTVQTDGVHNACVVCKQRGVLLCCYGKGCNRSYHLSCIDPPLKEVPPGGWHCLCCVRKKIESGVHAVSEGMEYVCDVRVGLSDCGGKEKQYLVKYKGLAHVHNRWIPEKEMLREAPMLVAKFNRKNQKEKVTLWNEDWTVPHRLLRKRLLMPPNLSDECFGRCGNDFSPCYFEWFVKWTGLGYEHATWEFENSAFLSSPEAMNLKRDFESCSEEARKASDPSRADKIKQKPFLRLVRLPDGCPSGVGDYLNSINKLREHWHKTQNAVLIDDQERIVKVILFLLSLQPDVSHPFLIISTSTTLSLWESEFTRLAPSLNVVVYNGNKEVRKMIRSLEFYEEEGFMKLFILLSPPDAIVEDFDALNSVDWEAVIIDECQRLKVSKHFNNLKTLSSNFRIAILNSQLKDNIAEYCSLLSFLDVGRNKSLVDGTHTDPDNTDTTASLAVVKERFFKYLVKEHKPDSLRFLEYWVPAQLSNVQLEQYCASLISQSLSLRSCSKVDHVGVLRDIVISLRKCCDHPYLVDDLLQGRLTEGLPLVEYLDVGVKAGGKLQLLDKILQEMKGRGQRVVIIFQLIGRDGRSTIGDILDDFLRQRFGPDSYERVDSGLPMSKRQGSLNMFNDKEKGRFVFLIENRACLPSIKLWSIDAAIIFSSDWNPLNDLRALQRISIDSQFAHVKVFRFYTPFTVEEKVLILAKQDVTLESNIPNISRSVSQSLLSWGASYLFCKLDEFHTNNPSGSVPSERLPSNELVLEVLAQLPQITGNENTTNCSIISEVQQGGVGYSQELSLLGEKEMPILDEELPHVFWSKLLEGRCPQWRYMSESSQRVRRKVQHLGELPKQPEVENDEARKKRRKVTSGTVNPISWQLCPQDKKKDTTFCKDTETPNGPATECTLDPSVGIPKKTSVRHVNLTKEQGVPGNQANAGSQWSASSPANRNGSLDVSPLSHRTRERSGVPMVESEERKKIRAAQKDLHLLLKPELSKLCKTLQLSADVNSMAEKFLEYIMNSRHVSTEPKTILQAFKISLCWRAASFLKRKVDHKASLALAKKNLGFECTDEEAESVYSRLRMLKKKFSHLKGASRNAIELNSLENESTAVKKDFVRMLIHSRTSAPATSSQQELEEGEIGESPKSHDCSEHMFLAEQDQTPISEIHPVKFHQHVGLLKDDILNRRIILVEKAWSKRREKLLRKQRLELEGFSSFRDDHKMKQQKMFDLELDLISALTVNSEVKGGKLNLRKQEISKRIEEFDEHMKGQRRKLSVMLVLARNKEEHIREHWLEKASNGTLAECFDKLPLTDSGFRVMEYKDDSEQDVTGDVLPMMAVSAPPRDNLNNDGIGSEQIECRDSLPAELPAIFLNVTTKDIPTRTDLAAPTNITCAANSGNDIHDGMDIDYGTATVAGPTPHDGMEKNKESSILASTSLQIQTEVPSTQASTNSVGDNSLPSHQVLSVQHERLAVSDALINGQGLSSSQSTLVPELPSADSAPSQAAPSNNEQMVSIPLQLPIAPDLTSAGIADTSGPLLSREENTGVMHDHTNTTELLEQRSFEATEPQAAESDQLARQNAAGELSLPNRQVPGSGVNVSPNQAVLVGHQSCGTAPPRARESDQPVRQPVVNGVPFNVSAPLERTESFQGRLMPNSDSFGMHTYLYQTELLGRHSFGAIAPQAGHSNQVAMLAEAAVSEPPPRTDIRVDRMEDLRSTPQEAGHLFLQPFLTTARLSPQEFQLDPLQNELTKIRKEADLGIQMHDNEKHRLKMELEKELDQVRKKYELLLNDAETKFMERKKTLDIIYNKVHLNQVLAEQFLSKFSDTKATATTMVATATTTALQGPRPSFVQQFIQVSQPQFVPRPSLVSASATVSPLGANPVLAANVASHLDPAIASAATIRAVGPSAVASLSSVPPVQLAQHSSARFSSSPPVPHHHPPILPPRANIHDGSVRSPAPHLHSSRLNTHLSTPSFPLQTGGALNQQQPPSNFTTSLPSLSASTNPPAYPPVDALRGTQQPERPGAVSIHHGTTFSILNLPVDGGNNCAGAHLPISSVSLDTGKCVPCDNEHPPSARDDTGPTAPAEVISLIDD